MIVDIIREYLMVSLDTIRCGWSLVREELAEVADLSGMKPTPPMVKRCVQLKNSLLNLDDEGIRTIVQYLLQNS